LKSNLSRKAAGFPLGLKDSPQQGTSLVAMKSVFIKKPVPESSIGIHRIRRNNIDWTVELERGMHWGDAVELPQHLLLPGLWVEGDDKDPCGKNCKNVAQKIQLDCPVMNRLIGVGWV
jgi:hypothetical protein